MKKVKRLISLFLAVLIVVTSVSVCFSAFADEMQAKSSAKVTEAQNAIDEFYPVRLALMKPTDANYEKSVAAFNDAAAKIKALSSDEKLSLDVKYYAFFLYFASEKIGNEKAGLSSSAAKVYGSSTDEGLKALTDIVGSFPKDYQNAIDIMRKIYVKVDGTLFNGSFDFQKKTAGYAHYDQNISAVSKLSVKGAEFANYIYPNGDGFYFYMTTPTGNERSDLYDNLSKITFNYFQDKAGKKDPSSISASTYIQGNKGSRTWKANQSAVTYKTAWEDMNAKFMEDNVSYGREAWAKVLEILSPVFGKEFKNAANLAYDTGLKNFNGEKITEADIDKVTAAIDAVTDPVAKAALSKIMSNTSLNVASSLVYKLGSADAYNEDADANAVYDNQISISKKNVNALVEDLQNVVNTNRLNEFVAYMNKVDANKLTDAIVKEAIEKYHAMSGEYQGKVPADVKEKLVNIATKGFYDIMKTVDMNKLSKDVQSKVYKKYVLMDEFKSTIPSELYDKYVLVQSPIMDMNNFAKEISAFSTTPIVRPENSKVAWTTGGIQSAVDKLWDLVANTLVPLIVKGVDLSDGLDSVLEDNLYKAEIVEAIFDLYATLIQNESEIEVEAMGSKMKFKLGQIISWIVSTDKIVDFLAADGDKYAGAIAKIKAVEGANATAKVVNLAEVNFSDYDFGFEDGDREGFADALLAVLRPITTLLAPDGKIKAMGLMDVNVEIKMFDYMTGDGKYQTGVYATLIPLLEQIGMVGLPTHAEYKANYESVKESKGAYVAADEFLRPVIDHLFTDVVDVVSPDPLNGLIKILPRVAHIINTDMLNSTIKEAAVSFGLLSDMLKGLDVSKASINALLAKPIDLTDLIGIKLTLPPIDWAKLADCCTLEAVESSSDFNKYFILRNGDTDSVFTTVFYYIYQVVFEDEDTYSALRKLIKDNLGAVASIVTNYTDKWVKIGAVETYGEVLDLLGTPTGDVIEKPVVPVNPENPVDPSNPSNGNNRPGVNLPSLSHGGDNANGSTANNSKVKKNIKNPLIPKTGGESTGYIMMAVYSVLAIAIAAAAVVYKKRKSDCAEK